MMEKILTLTRCQTRENHKKHGLAIQLIEVFNMLIDVTGTILTPGNLGRDCLGNGTHTEIECCCDECDFMKCCSEDHNPDDCLLCKIINCPRFDK